MSENPEPKERKRYAQVIDAVRAKAAARLETIKTGKAGDKDGNA